MFISGGSESGIYIVMARTEDNKISAFLVPADTPGLSYGKK
jgi:alkylation response protein AidB-like acyl-CoA dehydrogenase